MGYNDIHPISLIYIIKIILKKPTAQKNSHLPKKWLPTRFSRSLNKLSFFKWWYKMQGSFFSKKWLLVLNDNDIICPIRPKTTGRMSDILCRNLRTSNITRTNPPTRHRHDTLSVPYPSYISLNQTLFTEQKRNQNENSTVSFLKGFCL